MAVLRERPYVQFNFLVDLGTGNTEGADAGFQEVSGIGMEVTVAEYRNGNEKENSVRKITGLNKATDVTLKRGVIGSLSLYNWLNQIRNGDQNAMRNVTIQLQNEDHTEVVQTWKLLRARIIKHTSGPMNASMALPASDLRSTAPISAATALNRLTNGTQPRSAVA